MRPWIAVPPHGGSGKGRSWDARFIKGFPHCVYQEDPTNLSLEEGPASLFVRVSIIEMLRGRFIDSLGEGHHKSESVPWSAASLKSPLLRGVTILVSDLMKRWMPCWPRVLLLGDKYPNFDKRDFTLVRFLK